MHTFSRIQELWSLFLRRWHNAFSIILFYIAQFLLVIGIFGTTYAMVVSCSTTLFQLRRKEPNHAKDYISMCLTSPVSYTHLRPAATRKTFPWAGAIM